MNAELAGRLVAAAIAKAKADYGRPLCVAVCDRYGFLMAFASMDEAPVRSIALSQGKAYTSARMGVDTDAFLARLHANNIPASAFCDGRLVMVHEGGYSESYVPYCGLAVLEEMSGVRTAIEDIWAPLMASWGQQGLQPHQAAAIAKAEALIANLDAF